MFYDGEESLDDINAFLYKDDPFFKSLFSFMNDSDESSGYASEIFSPDCVVTCANFESFSSNCYENAIYKTCHLSTRLNITWSKTSGGLTASIRETPSHTSQTTNPYTPWTDPLLNKPTTCEKAKLDSPGFSKDISAIPTTSSPSLTIEEKNKYFIKYLQNSLLPEFNNHPVRASQISQEFIKDSKFDYFKSGQKVQRKPVYNISDDDNDDDDEDVFCPCEYCLEKLDSNEIARPSSAVFNPTRRRTSSVATAIASVARPPSVGSGSIGSLEKNQEVDGKKPPFKRLKLCKFCFKNGEPEEVYMGHYVKAPDGTVTCPILRRYTCDICGATGGKSHTRRYCPLNTEPPSDKPTYRRLANGVLTTVLNHK